jgi:hypothetical protein
MLEGFLPLPLVKMKFLSCHFLSLFVIKVQILIHKDEVLGEILIADNIIIN